MNLKTIADQFGMSEIDALTSESESAKMVRVMTAHHQFMNHNRKYRNVIQKMQFRANQFPEKNNTLKGQKDLANQILEQIASFLDSDLNYIISREKTTEQTWARYTFIHLSLLHLTLNFSQIGHMINRDHATVIHGKRKHKELMEYDEEYNRFCTNLCDYCTPLIESLKLN